MPYGIHLCQGIITLKTRFMNVSDHLISLHINLLIYFEPDIILFSGISNPCSGE